jgi:transcriptional regulator with XRE-family HTH domain
MEPQALFGKHVRNARKSTKRSRESAAEAAKISPNYLGEIERGEKWPSLDVIVALSETLGVPLESLFEFGVGHEDIETIKDDLGRLLNQLNAEQLRQASRVLRAMFSL